MCSPLGIHYWAYYHRARCCHTHFSAMQDPTCITKGSGFLLLHMEQPQSQMKPGLVCAASSGLTA